MVTHRELEVAVRIIESATLRKDTAKNSICVTGIALMVSLMLTLKECASDSKKKNIVEWEIRRKVPLKVEMKEF
ncbi:hypothetical protein ACTXT7_015828 [Hymenolepis weldensis]